jgi:SAM-dependent methyltransferase
MSLLPPPLRRSSAPAGPDQRSNAAPTLGSDAAQTQGSDAAQARGPDAAPTRSPDAAPTLGSDAAQTQGPDAAQAWRRQRGLLRSVRLFRLFRKEQTDPESFYGALAEDTVSQIEDYCDLTGRRVVDVGGGPGHFTAAFAERGARCYLFEPDSAEMLSRGTAPAGAVLADGYWLPVRDGGADLCLSSNVLEHVADPLGLIEEMVRATRLGGLIYLSFTNWYSPHGGHEMSPWHYLGSRFAERRYVRRNGRLPKNRFGVTLFPVHVGAILRLMRSRRDIGIVDALPRYYPRWCKPIVRIPGLREIATWNLVLVLRRIE